MNLVKKHLLWSFPLYLASQHTVRWWDFMGYLMETITHTIWYILCKKLDDDYASVMRSPHRWCGAVIWFLTQIWCVLRTLQWRHNEGGGVRNHQRLDCLHNCSFRWRSKKTSKLPVTGLCEGNSPVTGDFSAQRVSNAENVSVLMTSSWLAVTIRYIFPPTHDGHHPYEVFISSHTLSELLITTTLT